MNLPFATRLPLLLAVFGTLLSAPSIKAQSPAEQMQTLPQAISGEQPAEPSPNPTPTPLQENLSLAAIALQSNDLKGARSAIDRAIEIAPDDSKVMNLNAAILTYERKLTEARAIYTRLLEMASSPNDFALNWNLAEIDFLDGNYFSARKRLLQLREDRPQDEMLTYKILLTHLFEGKIKPALEELNRIPFPSNTAAYYYGRAAVAFIEAKELANENKEEESNKKIEEAMSWIGDAGRIFRLQHTLLFADSLIEKKLLNREQVTGLVPVPEPQPTDQNTDDQAP